MDQLARERRQPDPHPSIRCWIELRKAACQVAQPSLRLFHRNARPEPGQRINLIAPARSIRSTQAHRAPCFNALLEKRVRKLKAGRHNADDGVINRGSKLLEDDISANNMWVGAEVPPPESITQDKDMIDTTPLLLPLEGSTQQRRHSEERKEIGGAHRPDQALTTSPGFEDRCPVTKRGDTTKKLRLLLIVQKITPGNNVLVGTNIRLPKDNKPVGVAIWKRPQENG